MRDDTRNEHLTPDDAAAYVDGRLTVAERAAIDSHLAQCAECRSEVVDVTRLVRAAPQRRRWTILAPLAAAAAVFILFVAPRTRDSAPPMLREPAVTTTGAPTLNIPRGGVTVLQAMTWSSVPHADQYRVTLFDRDGSIAWRTQSEDTTVLLPDTVHITRGVPYYWKVDARIELGRWVSSELTSFTLEPPPRMPSR
jgi:anti-sigma factor ChrR (cupin superfamily)